MTTPSTPREPWDDDRLNAAFAARASRASTPVDLAGATRAALRTGPARTPLWRRVLAPAAVVVLAVGAVTGGIALLAGQRGSTGLVEFRDGPTADLRTLDAREFAFEYPADWLAYDSNASGSGVSSIAVLGTQPVEARCGDERHVDINCVYEQPLEPGDVRVYVGTGAYRGGTVLDRPDKESGTTTRDTVGGMPAILDELDPQPDSFYREDLSLHWSIGRPASPSNVVTIELRARESTTRGRTAVVAEARAALEALIASFRFDAAAFPSPFDWWAGRKAVGLPVVSVSDAIAIRDAGMDDREIAVHGFFHPSRPIPCPNALEPAVSPLQTHCPDQFIWLTQEPEALTIVEPNSMSGRPPTGPAISPELDLLDAAWMPGLPDLGPAFGVEVVFVGHFDDRRSRLCPDAEEEACRDRFVVDRVDWVNGETQPTSVMIALEGPTSSTGDEIAAIAQRQSPDGTILSLFATDGADGLVREEPLVATSELGLTDHAVLWGVRVLEGGWAGTYLIPDGTDEIYQMDPERVIRIAPFPTIEPPPSTTPPAAETVLGIPVISVLELIARRAEDLSPEEIAVRGWIASSNAVFDCAIHMDPHHPLVPFCQSPAFLMERPERVDGLTTDGPSVALIIGPDANVEVAITWHAPVEVVAIGHLDDHRWPTCPPAEQAACRRQFVVDRIVPVGASVEEIPDPWRIPGSAARDPAADRSDVIRRLVALVGDITVVSIGYVDGDVLREIEPAVGDYLNADALFVYRPLWVIRSLVAAGPNPAVARTFLVPDFTLDKGTVTIWEASESGVAQMPLPGAAVPWPPDGATIVELTSQVGAGRPPARVAVVDRSGWLTSVREVRSSDPPFPAGDQGNAVLTTDSAGQVRLLWIGGVCDGDMVVTIGESVRGITIDGGERPGCDAMGVGRELVLRFSEPIEADTVEIFYTWTLLPEE